MTSQLYTAITGLSVYTGYAHFEGCNIGSWIGFKHIMYLAEQAVLAHFRQSGLAARTLYSEYGLCFEVVDSSVRILHAIHIDEPVRVEVLPDLKPESREMVFKIHMFVDRTGKTEKVVSGTVRVLLRRDAAVVPGVTVPEDLVPFVCDTIERQAPEPRPLSGLGQGSEEEAVKAHLAPAGTNNFVWAWRIPYFYCHFTERLQHTGYLRLVEEVVDLFLADRGLSIRQLLTTKNWIPAVPNAQVELLREALMEERIYTVFQVEEVFKGLTFSARVDFYVVRDGALLKTATGRITHGYAQITGPQDWGLVEFDEKTIAVLSRRNP
jgi:acyl-CoA thioesterase FadM